MTGSDPSGHDPEARFWFAFLSLGFAVFVAESAMTELYLANNSASPHRGALATIAGVVGLAAAVNLVAVSWVSRQPWRRPFALGWTLVAGAMAALSIGLDGGMSSPMLLLLLMPVMYAGLAFSPAYVGTCVLASIAELIVIALADTGSDAQPGTLLIAMSAVVGVGLIVWTTSVHRGRLQRRTAELTHQLEVIASTDALTGCLNRRAFAERVDEEIARAVRYDHPLTLVFADFDHLKRVNDAHGHAAGDAALQTAGAVLRSRSRQPDVVARIGGDEFAVLLPATALGAAARLTHRLLAPIATGHGPMTFSAGVASLDHAQPTAESLFRDADLALYHAKRTGRAGVAVLPGSGSPVRLDTTRSA